jgi:hypothetical protein
MFPNFIVLTEFAFPVVCILSIFVLSYITVKLF